MSVFLYHFHGLGPFDFSELVPEDLLPLQKLAAQRELEIVPTIYLRRERLDDLVELLAEFGRLRADGATPNIAGFAVEGPLLGPLGGIPRAGRWYPSLAEWDSLARLGDCGLRYIVMAPDAMDLEDQVGPGFTFADLILSFYQHGVRLALGHFHRDNPDRSAQRVIDVVDFLHERFVSSRYLVLTDHLYNDMPRAFTHAWRGAEQRQRRDEEVAQLMAADWSRDNLVNLLGPVPAAMLCGALDDRLVPCVNFDGEHVDLAIAGRTADLLGEDRLIVLTDHTELDVMAGELLTKDQRSGLRLRDDGLVAAGSSGPEAQRANMVGLGIAPETIDRLFYRNPHDAIHYEVSPR